MQRKFVCAKDLIGILSMCVRLKCCSELRDIVDMCLMIVMTMEKKSKLQIPDSRYDSVFSCLRAHGSERSEPKQNVNGSPSKSWAECAADRCGMRYRQLSFFALVT